MHHLPDTNTILLITDAPTEITLISVTTVFKIKTITWPHLLAAYCNFEDGKITSEKAWYTDLTLLADVSIGFYNNLFMF